uniref:SRCR domain-containing protein n=1 Tax=Chromera velia CCMP2878 TaxID=1169474 RepID=A0A0G4G9J7_9ALVE|eukprot:Cvel_20878.t1-p1 / transcript=Cvel_20878.t1 / gene=Cvel_20878 / organism=Chromera_velia_CCMP2878 / gene_product=hypothetical protein / transcript_product=hypothetical protein / location=Cvel_scaffold1913:36144-36599(+) / protein_length=152 / sequence_SO=supercontig / SO=protein_coding / is_pseudo=false
MKFCLVLTAFSAVTVQAQWENLGDKLADGLKFDFSDLFGGKDGVKDVQKGKEKKEKPPKVECPAGWIPVPKSPWDTFIGRERCFQCVGGSEVNRTAAVDACTALGGGTPNSQFLLTIDSFEINQLAATTCQEMGLFSMRGKLTRQLSGRPSD